MGAVCSAQPIYLAASFPTEKSERVNGGHTHFPKYRNIRPKVPSLPQDLPTHIDVSVSIIHQLPDVFLVLLY